MLPIARIVIDSNPKHFTSGPYSVGGGELQQLELIVFIAT